MRRTILTILTFTLLLTGLTPCARAEGPPAISAAAAILVDGESGRVLYARNENEQRAIASITKLMTALVAAECLEDLDQPVVIRQEWTGIEGTSLYLRPGEELTARTLLYGLLLHSGNDAAVALAAHCAGDVDTFVGWMNRRAADLGMTRTHFSDPNGLGDEDHYSTAADMAKLARACLENDTVREIVSTRSIALEGRSFTNHNKLLWQYPGCTGMKTGYTRQAGRTLVSSAERDGQTLVCVTLHAPDDWADHTALLDYGFETWPRQVLAAGGAVVRTIPVTGSLLRTAPVKVRETVVWPVGEGETVTMEVRLPEQIPAPVVQGKIAGEVSFFLDGQPIGGTYLVWGASAGRDVLTENSPWSPLGWLKGLGDRKT